MITLSANVWFEEVDTGFVKEIKNTVKYIDENGVKKPVKNVVVRKPEEDFKIEVFPCVSVYNLDYKHDPLRYDPQPVMVRKSSGGSVFATMEESAISFNLNYQIDFWARYQTDMNLMTRTWLSAHFRQFNLPVVDDGGVERTCNVLATGGIVKSDLLLNKERLYHSIYKCVVWVELDDNTQFEAPTVQEVVIDDKVKINRRY